jgi:hypothetical protein
MFKFSLDEAPACGRRGSLSSKQLVGVQSRPLSQFAGSGHTEKANDLTVARRQKHRGMQRSLDTSDALTTLKTLMLNRG